MMRRRCSRELPGRRMTFACHRRRPRCRVPVPSPVRLLCSPGRVRPAAVAPYRGAVQYLIAIGVALSSAVCYAIAAVLQQREASRHDMHGLELIFSLLRRPRWWMAVTSTLAGASLHVVALKFGPLTLVQPLGGVRAGHGAAAGGVVRRPAGAAGGVDRGGRRGGGPARRPHAGAPPRAAARRAPGGAGHRDRHLPGCAAGVRRHQPAAAAEGRPGGARRRVGGVLRLRLGDGPPGRRGQRPISSSRCSRAGSSPSPAC